MDQAIERFLDRDPLRTLAARELYKQKDSRVLSFAPDGLLLEAAGLHALSADTAEGALRICEGVKHIPLLIVDCREAVPALAQKYGYQRAKACYNVVYGGAGPVKVQAGVHLSPLGEEHVAAVAAHYDLMDESEVRRHIQDGTLLGGFAFDEWVGFIGIHDEGSMGMLHVFDGHRRKGMGFMLEGLLINRLLMAGKTPWAQIFVENTASLALQQKLGMVRAETPITWMSRPKENAYAAGRTDAGAAGAGA